MTSFVFGVYFQMPFYLHFRDNKIIVHSYFGILFTTRTETLFTSHCVQKLSKQIFVLNVFKIIIRTITWRIKGKLLDESTHWFSSLSCFVRCFALHLFANCTTHFLQPFVLSIVLNICACFSPWKAAWHNVTEINKGYFIILFVYLFIYSFLFLY